MQRYPTKFVVTFCVTRVELQGRFIVNKSAVKLISFHVSCGYIEMAFSRLWVKLKSHLVRANTLFALTHHVIGIS